MTCMGRAAGLRRTAVSTLKCELSALPAGTCSLPPLFYDEFVCRVGSKTDAPAILVIRFRYPHLASVYRIEKSVAFNRHRRAVRVNQVVTTPRPRFWPGKLMARVRQ